MLRLSERLRLRRPSESPFPRSKRPRTLGPTTAPADVASALDWELRRDIGLGQLACEEHAVSRELYARLGAEEIAEIEHLTRETPEFQAVVDAASPAVKRMLALHCGMWHRLDSVAHKTGLLADQPPEDIHAMARGPLAAAGGLYEADLIADAFASAGVRVADARRVLDFGCSSGRVVRVLAAAFPQVHWLGCDPNARAISWAAEHLPRIEFFGSGNEPPIRLEEASLDAAFAVSIWSHFEPVLGLRWFDEMHRVLAPAGCLMMTTHGLTSVAHYAETGLRSREQCEEIADALYRRGWWYAPEFGKRGDWGVVNPAWGTSFLSPEWLLSELCPAWRVVEFAAGRNSANQDVYVLQRA